VVPLWIPGITRFTPLPQAAKDKVIGSKRGGCRRCRRRLLGADDGQPYNQEQAPKQPRTGSSEVDPPHAYQSSQEALEQRQQLRKLNYYMGGVQLERNDTCTPTNYTTIDWSLVFPPVKDQGLCASGWAFTAVAMIGEWCTPGPHMHSCRTVLLPSNC